jgi:hypothetical protein
MGRSVTRCLSLVFLIAIVGSGVVVAINPAPTLSAMSPSSGPISGGTTVTLTGTNFVSGATVKFGSTASTSVSFVSSTSINAVAPTVSSASTVTVTVTNPDGQSAFLGSAQLLPNPGFESGTANWQLAQGSGTASIVNNAANAHTGSWYGDAAITASNSHPVIFGAQTTGSNYFPVTPGDTISFAGWAYRASGSGGFSRFSIASYDINKANPNYLAASPNTVTTAAWLQQSGSYTVPAGKAFITFYFEIFGATTNGDARCDEASLIQNHGTGYQYTSGGATLQSIAVTPANPSLGTGVKLQFTATGHYNDGSSQNLTTSVSWASSNTAAATISNTSGTQGQATGVAAGTTNISATSGAIVGSTTLTVITRTLQSLSIAPVNATLGLGAKLQYTATGNYSDGSTQNLTTSSTWSSTNTGVATVSNTSGSHGVATGIAAGSTTIGATAQGIAGSTGLSVSTSPGISPQFMSMSIFSQNFGPTTLPGNYWPSVPFGGFRLWDTHTGWPDLETSNGVYRWDVLNGWLNFAQSHGINDVMYTFGSTAVWASSNPTDTTCKYGPGTCDSPSDIDINGVGTDQMWIDFVTNLVTVGKGRIKYYQLWDTPQDKTHWTGSIYQLVRMSQDAYNTIKAIDPNAKVLSPPSGAYHGAPNTCMIANRETNFFKNGGGAYSDIISFNTYYDEVAEDIIPVIACLKTMLTTYGQNTKPLWASEGGWGTSTDLSDQTLQSAFLARSYLILLSQGVSRFYWYAWNNPNWGTLYNKNLGVLPPGKAYGQVYGWIVGRSLSQPCAVDANGVWTCVLTGGNGYQAQATWVQGASQSYTPPSQYIRYRNLLGTATSIAPSQQITITTSPILLENQ